MEANQSQEVKPVALAQLPVCFGKTQLDCLMANCQVWESCIRRRGTLKRENAKVKD